MHPYRPSAPPAQGFHPINNQQHNLPNHQIAAHQHNYPHQFGPSNPNVLPLNPQNDQGFPPQNFPQNVANKPQQTFNHVQPTPNSNYLPDAGHMGQQPPHNFNQRMYQPQQTGLRPPNLMNVNQNMHGAVMANHHRAPILHSGEPALGYQTPVQPPAINHRPQGATNHLPINNQVNPSLAYGNNQVQPPVNHHPANNLPTHPMGYQVHNSNISSMKPPQQVQQFPSQMSPNPQQLPHQKTNPSEGANVLSVGVTKYPQQNVLASNPANGQQNQIPNRPMTQEVGRGQPMLANPLLKKESGKGPSQSQQMNSSEGNKKVGQQQQRYAEDDDDDDDDYTDRSESCSTDSSTTSSSHDGGKKDDIIRSTPQQQQVQKQTTAKMSPYQQQQYIPPTNQTSKHVPQSEYKTQSLETNFQRMQIETNRTCIDLLREHNIIADLDYEESLPPLQKHMMQFNCPPDIMSSTLNIVPNSSNLLNKSRLPFGVLIHPLKDIQDLPESKYLVRCRTCRTYINPFVTLIDLRRWICNICYRYNDLPDDFLYDPDTRSYTDGRHRPQMNSSCYEILTTPDQSVKDKHIPTYAFVIDVSFNAIETGYLPIVCEQISENLDELANDPKSNVCFLTFDSHIQFYNLHHSLTQPSIYHVTDLEDITLPTPSGLLVNVDQSKDMIRTLLKLLPSMHKDTQETGNCLGVALKTACQLLGDTGGRVTVFQTKIPDVGEGCLKPREDPNKRACEDIQHLKPATDFYKNIAIECSSKQIGFDLFFLNSQYVDMATICPVAKFTGGCIEYFPNFNSSSNPVESDRFRKTLTRYLTREMAFEAVLRIRCTRGLSFQMFHGNAFVRSMDLLSLPVTNADAGFGVQVAINDTIEDPHACFQAALLYTNNRGERRLRVMNLCLKVSSDVTEVMYNANQQAVVAFVAKMAADRAFNSSVKDSREALHNVALDMLQTFGKTLNQNVKLRQLPCPYLLRALPLFVFSLMKSTAFRLGISTKLDDRVFALEQLKTLPWPELLQVIYPHFYALHKMDEKNVMQIEDKVIYHPSMSSLTAGALDRQGMHLMDTGSHMYLWMSPSVDRQMLKDVLGVSHFGSVREGLTELPALDNPVSENIRNFIEYLNNLRQIPAPLVLIRDDSRDRVLFYAKMIEDRTADLTNMSYIEFLRTLQDKLSND